MKFITEIGKIAKSVDIGAPINPIAGIKVIFSIMKIKSPKASKTTCGLTIPNPLSTTEFVFVQTHMQEAAAIPKASWGSTIFLPVQISTKGSYKYSKTPYASTIQTILVIKDFFQVFLIQDQLRKAAA